MQQQQQQQQHEFKRAKIQPQQDDDQTPMAAALDVPSPFSSDPTQFYQRMDPNKHSLAKPCCIGEFSLDRTRRQQLGRSRVRYFNERTLGQKLSGANLGENFHTFVPKADTAEVGIEQLLQWIMTISTPNSSLRKTVHECDFVLWRGTLTRLSCSPYDASSFSVGVKVACTKHKGVYFVNEFDTEAKLRTENTRSDYQRRMCYGGFKFEQLVTVDNLPLAAATAGEKNGAKTKAMAEPVDQNNEFVGIFKATLSCSSSLNSPTDISAPPLRLLYGAEIDCISPVYGEFMEIKTQYKGIGHGKGFVTKALKWWIQSYLIGIKQLIVGTHENLILNRVELFPVDSLPKLVSSCWSGPVCLQFLFQLLHYIRRSLDALPEGFILLAERLPNAREFKFRVIGPDDDGGQCEYCVLSETFKKHLWQ